MTHFSYATKVVNRYVSIVPDTHLLLIRNFIIIQFDPSKKNIKSAPVIIKYTPCVYEHIINFFSSRVSTHFILKMCFKVP